MAENNPFNRLPVVPSFQLSSSTVPADATLPAPQLSGEFGVPGGADVSPQLSWSGAPENTRSFAITVYDPDAPTGSGFWHWVVANIPAGVNTIAEGAGTDDGDGLPAGALQLRNDAGSARYIGGAPPAGHGPHRYFITVWALDVDDIGVAADSTPAYLGFLMAGHTLARATLTATAEIVEAA